MELEFGTLTNSDLNLVQLLPSIYSARATFNLSTIYLLKN